jgi:hypothetical protein
MPLLEFDEEAHVYTVDGRRVPSVTQLLKPLEDLSMVPPAVLEHARQRGKAVHKAVEFHETGGVKLETIDPECRPYFEAYLKFKADNPQFRILKVEQRVDHHALGYAGTLDLDALGDGGIPAILDIKCRAAISPVEGVQTAGYALARGEKTGFKPGRYGLQLRKDGTYRLTKYDSPDDYRVWLALVSLHNWKAKHGINI